MINPEECENKDDKDLVLLSLKDKDYFYCIINRYERVILHYIMKISSFSKEDAEDVLQEVFFSVYENLNEFDSSLKFSSWIYRIAHNKTISRWRKFKSRPKNVYADKDVDLFSAIASEENIAKELDRKLSAEELNLALNNLEVKYKEVLVLKFLEDKDYREISDILKKPMGTVATLINRAKGKLKIELEKIDFK